MIDQNATTTPNIDNTIHGQHFAAVKLSAIRAELETLPDIGVMRLYELIDDAATFARNAYYMR